VVHVSPAPTHVAPQHSSPAPPHARQTFSLDVLPDPEPADSVTHSTAAAVHPIEQQFCPAPPHTLHPASAQAFPQLESAQSPPLEKGQTDPAGVQTPATQHPPDAHSSAGQQASPAPPQSSQKLLPLQTVPDAHELPAPQSCPASPVGAQAPS